MSSKVDKYFKHILEPELIKEIVSSGKLIFVRQEDILIDYGQNVEYMPLVLSGLIRIMRDGDQDNELFLYYLASGETCAFSMTCCMQTKKSEVMAIAEEDTEVWMIPVKFMSQWLSKYNSWKEFVLSSYNRRFDEMLDTIDSIAFLKMDERLTRYLEGKRQNSESNVIKKTHQDIAQELNTSRVVVSRLLKQLERSGKIKLYRNRIEVH